MTITDTNRRPARLDPRRAPADGDDRRRGAQRRPRRRRRASDELFAELQALLLQHKVLFFRDQDITRAEHVALAERFGPLEDHPVAGSDPDHPGLVRIYKDLDSPPEHYENAYHCDATWREATADGLPCCAASRRPRSAATPSG